ncbi:uncharacterized protein BDV17DRAFT_286706 [Aspergillus undulatus]|uniref:uncharacterized protein n=1 Tax=Aspergillus undulatus TaxID=1810928 RepID=UPI003CCE4C18
MAIVDLIPLDPEAYLAWVEKMKATYSRLSIQYENDVLCVPPKFCQPSAVISDKERFSRSYHALDDRLWGPPTQALLLASDGDIFIEWTYTIDLDRELFVVDRAAVFNLRNLPNHPNWYKFLGSDQHRRRVLKTGTPPALVGLLPNTIEVDSNARERYNSFKVEVKFPEVIESLESINPSRVALLIRAISAVCHKYRHLIDGFYQEWTANSFPFREIAFAILSIAAGEIAFKSPEDLNARYANQGFYLIPNAEHPDNQQTLLPRFLYECHQPSAISGSAPQKDLFWLGNVLVYLTPRTDLVGVEEAAISTVTDSGLGQGLESFHAIVFSILDIVFIQVKKEGNGDVRVTRSPLTSLLHFDDDTSRYANGPRSRDGQAPTPVDTSARNQPEDGPQEEQDDNVDEGDNAGEDDGDDDKSDSENSPTNSGNSNWFASLAATLLDPNVDDGSVSVLLEDLSTGNKMPSSLTFKDLDSFLAKKPENSLHLVVGTKEPDRRSIIDALSFALKFPSKRPPYASITDKPVIKRDYRSRNGIGPEQLFDLPDHLFLDIYQDAYLSYILGILDKEDTSQHYAFALIQGARWPCLLPLGYRELSLPLHAFSGMRMVFRSKSDKSPEEWTKTMDYAAQKIHEDVQEQDDFRWDFRAKGGLWSWLFTER